MNKADKQYIDLLQLLLSNKATVKDDRTGTGTRAIFGHQMRFNLKNGFPLLTTKKVNFKAILYELLWFLSGDTNVKYLIDNNVNIWTANAKDYYTKSKGILKLSDEEYKSILNEDSLAGDCGKIYGFQWRDFNGEVDQIKNLINGLKENPDSRRHIVTAWNPSDLSDCALPPCHILFQCFSEKMENGKRRLSLQYYMRSNDIFLGCPFNIASYALLTHIIAKITDHEVGDLVATLGDAHIYMNHIDQAKQQIHIAKNGDLYKLPKLKIKGKLNSLDDLRVDKIELIGYKSHPSIYGKMSV